MESNGQDGRIHVSEATARLLMSAGKEHWLAKREDLVQAKGKGSMQTYWVNASSECAMTTFTSTESSMSDFAPQTRAVPTLLGVEEENHRDVELFEVVDEKVDPAGRLEL